jgi:hypothetical protein
VVQVVVRGGGGGLTPQAVVHQPATAGIGTATAVNVAKAKAVAKINLGTLFLPLAANQRRGGM